jgi:hypothetical protein
MIGIEAATLLDASVLAPLHVAAITGGFPKKSRRRGVISHGIRLAR